MDLALTLAEPVGAFAGGAAVLYGALRWRRRVPKVSGLLDRAGITDHEHEYKHFDRVAPYGRCDCGAFRRKPR